MQLTIGMRNAGIDAVAPQANGGRVDFLAGPVPSPDGGLVSGNAVLFSLPVPAGSFGTAANAQSAMAGLPVIVAVLVDGTNTFARVYNAGGQQLWDAYPGTDYALDSLDVLAGGTVKVNSFVYRKPA